MESSNIWFNSVGFSPVGFIVAELSPLKASHARPILVNKFGPTAVFVYALMALLWTLGPIVALGRETVDVLTSWAFDRNL